MATRGNGLNDQFDENVRILKDLKVDGIIEGNTITPINDPSIVNKKYVDTKLLETFPTNFSQGAILFVNNGLIAQNQQKLNWDVLNSRVGIGTEIPGKMVEIVAPTNAPASLQMSTYSVISARNSEMYFRRAKGTEANPLDISNGNAIGSMRWDGFFNTDWRIMADILCSVDGTPVALGSNIPGRLRFRTSNGVSGIQDVMVLTKDARVGICTTTPDTILQVVGDCKFGDDNTNYVEVGTTGDVVFVGGAGLCFGGISLYDNTTADSIATATLTQLTRFDTNDPANNTSPDHTNDHITITKAGMYMVTMSVAFSGTGSVTWTGGVYKNNGATQLTNLQTHRKLGASGDVGSATVTGIADLAVNDTVEVWFTQSEGVNKNITVKDCTLSLVQVGGT